MDHHNFPEDSSHENGNYNNTCCLCKVTFIGHKRRVCCKQCQSENRYAVYRSDVGVWMRSHAVHQESAARTVAQAAMRAVGIDANDFRLRDRIIVAVSPVVNAMLDSVQTRRDYLERAIDAGGWDMSPCGGCGQAVVCLPDGLPMCESCAAKASS